MRKLILIFTLAFTTISFAQTRNGQRQRQMFPSEQKAPEPDFKIKKYLGILNYDIEKTAKKSGVKLTSEKGKSFSKILKKYNRDINDITRINSFLLKSTKDMVDNFQKKAMETGDYSNQPKVVKTMGENLKPISKTVISEDKKLNASMKNLLSEKQHKKWIKYNKKLNKKFLEK